MKWLDKAIILTLLPCLASASAAFLEDIEKIKTQSVTLTAQVAKLKSAQSDLFAQTMAWTPTIAVSLGQQNVKSNSSVLNSNLEYWKVSSEWNLFRSGYDLKTHTAADLTEQAQQFRVREEELKLEARAAALIFHQLYLQDVIVSTQELVRLRDESHHIIQEKFRQGQSPQQEVMKSEVDRTQQQNRLRSLLAEQLQTQAQWKALLHSDLRTKSWPLSSDQKIPLLQNAPSPSVSRLAKLAEASEHLWKATRLLHGPSLDLLAEYQEWPLKDRSSVGVTTQWTTGLMLTLPLWSRGETQAKSASAYAQVLSTRAEFEEAQYSENAQREVLSQRVEWARQNLVASRENLEKSQKLYRDMLKSFRFGRLSMNELLIEQNRLIEAALGLGQSQWDFHRIAIESCGAAGITAASCFKN